MTQETVEPTWVTEYARPCVAEFFAVMVFVFAGTMSMLSDFQTAIALAHGFSFSLLVASFGHISGGHVNPVVTLGVWLAGGIKPIKAILYIICQTVGGIAGAALCRGTLSYVPHGNNATQYLLISGGMNIIPAGVPMLSALLAEIVLTMILVMTVLMTSVNTEGKTAIHPIVIGFSVLVDIILGINVSGASMNPARSFGPAVVISDMLDVWGQQWVYWVGPTCGAIIAALFFRLIFGQREKRLNLVKGSGCLQCSHCCEVKQVSSL